MGFMYQLYLAALIFPRQVIKFSRIKEFSSYLFAEQHGGQGNTIVPLHFSRAPGIHLYLDPEASTIPWAEFSFILSPTLCVLFCSFFAFSHPTSFCLSLPEVYNLPLILLTTWVIPFLNHFVVCLRRKDSHSCS